MLSAGSGEVPVGVMLLITVTYVTLSLIALWLTYDVVVLGTFSSLAFAWGTAFRSKGIRWTDFSYREATTI